MLSPHDRAGLKFATWLALGFIAVPVALYLSGLSQSTSPRGIWIVPASFAASLIACGAVAGQAVAPRHGRVAFALAFVLLAILGWFALAVDILLLPVRQPIIDVVYSVPSYAVVFAISGALGSVIVTRQWRATRAAASSFGLGGLLGGIIFSLVILTTPRSIAVTLAIPASLGIAGFLGGRRVARLIRQSGVRYGGLA